MTRSALAGLVLLWLAIAVGTAGGLWHLYATHRMPALAKPEGGAAISASTPAGSSTETTSASKSAAPQTADRGPPIAETPPVARPSEARPTSPAAPSSSAPPTAAAPAARPDERAAITPSFDVVRVEPKGDTVVAGKGAPNARIALMSGGKVLGETKSDASGQFVILPPPLKPGVHALTLRQTPDGAPTKESKQSVAVAVPAAGGGKVVVALAEPGRPTKVLSPVSAAPSGRAAGTPEAKVAIQSVELENGHGFYASGVASPRGSLHLYLNDTHIADVVAGPEGQWSVRVRHGLTGGHYGVRADAVGADGRVVTSRAEVSFDVPVAMAEAATPTSRAPSSAPPPAAPSGAADTTAAERVPAAVEPASGSASPDVTIDSVETARIVRGDNLWNISRMRLGDATRYTQIYAANADQIRDPNLIYPGQVFVVPTR